MSAGPVFNCCCNQFDGVVAGIINVQIAFFVPEHTHRAAVEQFCFTFLFCLCVDSAVNLFCGPAHACKARSVLTFSQRAAVKPIVLVGRSVFHCLVDECKLLVPYSLHYFTLVQLGKS